MNRESKENDARKHSRIGRNFVVRFRAKDGPGPEWQVATLKDISEGGCSFISNVPFHIGQLLDVRIQFPILSAPMEFVGEVRRCESRGGGPFSLYFIGVLFQGMGEQNKKEFVDMINFFLKKKQG